MQLTVKIARLCATSVRDHVQQCRENEGTSVAYVFLSTIDALWQFAQNRSRVTAAAAAVSRQEEDQVCEQERKHAQGRTREIHEQAIRVLRLRVREEDIALQRVELEHMSALREQGGWGNECARACAAIAM